MNDVDLVSFDENELFNQEDCTRPKLSYCGRNFVQMVRQQRHAKQAIF